MFQQPHRQNHSSARRAIKREAHFEFLSVRTGSSKRHIIILSGLEELIPEHSPIRSRNPHEVSE
jgi:hypothetical protein